MKKPDLKVDVLINVNDVSTHYGTLQNFISQTIEQSLSEAGLKSVEYDVDKIVEESSFIRFTVADIPFTVKIT